MVFTSVNRTILLLVVLLTSGTAFSQNRSVIPPPGITAYQDLNQNWKADTAEWFYNAAQGSKLLPFEWFLYLEQPDSNQLFRDPIHMRSLGYLPRAESEKNPNGLPVGFVKDGTHLGITCAACHTTEITYQGKAWLVDGAPTLADAETFLRRIATALKMTLTNAEKFKRFSEKVLGTTNDTDVNRTALREQLKEVFDVRDGYNTRNFSRDEKLKFGPGRLDAFGAILNEVTNTFAEQQGNHFPATAPVSYPFLWDTPHHDRVQWIGNAANDQSKLGLIVGTKHIGALGRNVGEVLGVFGDMTVIPDGLIIPKAYPSTVNIENMIKLEDSVRELWSPQWPIEFGAIDSDKKGRGEELYKTHCADCHQPINRTAKDRKVTAWLKESVGTDPQVVLNVATRKAKTGLFEHQIINLPGIIRFGPQASPIHMLEHSVKRVILGGGMNGNRLARLNPEFQVDFSFPVQLEAQGNKYVGRFHSLDVKDKMVSSASVNSIKDRLDLTLRTAEQKLLKFDSTLNQLEGRFLDSQNQAQSPPEFVRIIRDAREGMQLVFDRGAEIKPIYKGRPLNGIWATAPYLHNGSIPNLDELLKKPEKRIAKFKVGRHEFEPKVVGFRTDLGDFEFDTSRDGNRNIGHDYGPGPAGFSDSQRADLIEYLKSL